MKSDYAPVEHCPGATGSYYACRPLLMGVCLIFASACTLVRSQGKPSAPAVDRVEQFARVVRTQKPILFEQDGYPAQNAWVRMDAAFLNLAYDEADIPAVDERTFRRMAEMWVRVQMEFLEHLKSLEEAGRKKTSKWGLRDNALQELYFQQARSMPYRTWLKERLESGWFDDDKNARAWAGRLVERLDKIVKHWGRQPTSEELLELGLLPHKFDKPYPTWEELELQARLAGERHVPEAVPPSAALEGRLAFTFDQVDLSMPMDFITQVTGEPVVFSWEDEEILNRIRGVTIFNTEGTPVWVALEALCATVHPGCRVFVLEGITFIGFKPPEGAKAVVASEAQRNAVQAALEEALKQKIGVAGHASTIHEFLWLLYDKGGISLTASYPVDVAQTASVPFTEQMSVRQLVDRGARSAGLRVTYNDPPGFIRLEQNQERPK